MDKHTYDNWVRVKDTFESTGNIENFLYKRACAIIGGSPDPIDKVMPKMNYGNKESSNPDNL